MIREKILIALKENADGISGEELSSKLGVSRTAVWKHIKILKEMGYPIQSKPRVGYFLDSHDPIISEEEIAYLLKQRGIDFLRPYFFESIGSTNDFAKKLDHEAIILSLEQTKGRGRMGRVWDSKRGDGFYFSLVLQPEISPQIVGMMTQIAAIAMRRAIAHQAMIKWPNDIYIHGKKIVGILTELRSEISYVQQLIIGIGTNLKTPEEFKDLATSYEDEKIKMSVLESLGKFLDEFYPLYKRFVHEKNLDFVLEELNEYSFLKNQKVRLPNSDEEYIFESVDVNGNAILKDKNGASKEVFFGEISLSRGEK